MKKYFYIFFLIFSILISRLLVFNPLVSNALNNFFHDHFVEEKIVMEEFPYFISLTQKDESISEISQAEEEAFEISEDKPDNSEDPSIFEKFETYVKKEKLNPDKIEDESLVDENIVMQDSPDLADNSIEENEEISEISQAEEDVFEISQSEDELEFSEEPSIFEKFVSYVKEKLNTNKIEEENIVMGDLPAPTDNVIEDNQSISKVNRKEDEQEGLEDKDKGEDIKSNNLNSASPILSDPEVIYHLFNPFNEIYQKILATENTIKKETIDASNEKLVVNAKEKKRKEIKKTPKVDFISGGIRHIETKGIGYDKGYSTFEVLFFPELALIDWSVFFDLRLHYFNNGVFASNAGTGFRYLTSSCENIFGLNIYYDFRDTRYNFQIHQIGVGGEVFRDRFEGRINLYFPLNNDKFLTSSSKDYSGGYVLTTEEFEGSLKSFFVEGGYWIEKTDSLSIFGAVSQYYLHRDTDNHAVGGKTRIRIEFEKYLSLEGSVSYDSIFHMRYQGQISLRFPLGKSSIKKSKKSFYQNIHRNDIIPVTKTREFVWNW